MPTYEYKCNSCELSFEQRQGFDAEPVCTCPRCQNEAQRLFRPAPIIFKGKGFYVTDYPSSSSTAGRCKSEESSEAEPKKETKATSEPAPVAASKSATE